MNRQSVERASFFSIFISVFAAAAFLLLTWPVWQWLWQEWMGNEYYSHGVLIPFVSVFLIVQRVRRDPTFAWWPDRTKWTGLAVLAGSMALFIYFLNTKAFYLASFAMIGLLIGAVWTLGGASAIGKLAFPLLYLVFMVPLPFVERATLPLAMFTGVCSGALVRFLGLNITIVGNAVTLPDANLIIGAQCSGINSLIALTALTTLAAYVVEGALWRKIALVLVSIPLAILGNILRVASLLWVARVYGAEAGFIFYHDYSGILFFALALLLLYPIARLLRCNTLRTDVI